MTRFFKTFITAFVIFSLFFGGIIVFVMRSENGKDTLASTITDLFKGDNDKKEITFLLLGIDSKDLNKNKNQRTDTIMLCKYDDTTGKVSILSLPRDTMAIIRGRQNKEKINHAHAYGGPDLSIKAVKDLLGVDVEYFVRVDYKIVEEVVDLIGGVEVDVPMDMKYSDPVADPPLHIDIKKGKQTLNGKKSLEFLRYRKGYKDQDLGRIKAQQQFMNSAIKQALNPINIIKLPKFIDTYFKNVDTNIPLDVIAKFALKAKNVDTDNIEMATLPGEPKLINGIWYFVHNPEESQEMVNNMFLDHNVVMKNEEKARTNN
ncbi:transcriptional attenuator, LytR family [Proteiniborus ethanoligenes]|uniref:Transcriptional attenuator, LytR family n=1 Tax=Proteiniborus ethanoligenes TaxID=415015 RepID=A0A1H3S970_9FIRM|nr:LCP family protein [Proteiniborus ethanoligenes]TAH63772.1 MAG: LytR family transcriptional regulator [Gottschalkiaceae bacterium]SDZ34464.1 transcriptional attenuator, LytR family [Proteiniborus ethanoligenes]